MAAHRLACGLGLRVWKGSGGAHRTVVIAGALGVKQRFYEKYAAHVSSEGLNAVTFDYVGVGASKPEGYEHATLDDWATNQDDVLGYASDEFDKPITLVGHSIGAQFLGTLARRDRVDRLLTISSMNNELRHQRQNGLALQAFWKVGVPALCSAFGRFPAKSLGLFEDVPSAVMLGWRRWVLEGSPWHDGTTPAPGSVASLSFGDDEYGDLAAVRSFHDAAFGDATTYLRPDIAGVGHHGFFKERHASLWRDVHGWVDAG